MSSPPIVLVFAGADPSGGAGLQADLLTLAARGCHPLSVVTAITVQDTTGVKAVHPVEASWVADQARLVLQDIRVSAIKIGLVGSVEGAAAIRNVVAEHAHVPVVLDPVLASGRGDPLLNPEGVAALRDLLVPQATVVTPNSSEARRLAFLGDEARGEVATRDEAARRLLELGCEFVLVTGTDEPTTEVINTLYAASGAVLSDRWERLADSYHGSGCTLASAIAAAIANGLPVPEAVRDAQTYTWQTLAHGFRPGLGQYVPDRFYQLRNAMRAAVES